MREIKVTLTEADFVLHPEYGMAGFKIGQEVTITSGKEGKGIALIEHPKDPPPHS